MPGRKIEMGCLLALCLFLPVFEAPKTLAWLAFVVVWLVNRSRAKEFGGPWDAWDTVIGIWLASALMSAVFADTHGKEWRGAMDAIRYGTVLWLVKRSTFQAHEARWVLAALVASTMLGLAWSYSALWAGAPYLQLNSVGHVNHTAIYLAIMFGVATAWLLAGRKLMAIVAALFLISLFVAASRAAVGTALVLLVVLSLMRRRARAVVAGLAAVAIVTAAAVVGRLEVVEKQIQSVRKHDLLAHRDGVWAIAIETWLRHPLFGAGMGNFASIAREQAKETRLAQGANYDATQHYDVGHAHSIYLNTLAERGALGALSLIAFLSLWAIQLWRFYRIATRSSHDWLLWGSSASAWIVAVTIGVVNTTLHHEHALLSMILLGLWLAHLRANTPQPRADA